MKQIGWFVWLASLAFGVMLGAAMVAFALAVCIEGVPASWQVPWIAPPLGVLGGACLACMCLEAFVAQLGRYRRHRQFDMEHAGGPPCSI